MARQWNSQTNFEYDDTYFNADGTPVQSGIDSYLGTVSGNAIYQPKVKNYLSGLQSNYGLTNDDFNKALQNYGATYSDNGFLNDKNVGWWGEDAMLRAFGTGLDSLNPNAAYKGSWQSMYDQNAEKSQQKDFADRFAANEANQGSDLADLGDIMKGVGLVAGVGGLAGAFGGLGAATGGGGALSSPLAGVGSFEAGSALPGFGVGDGIASGLASQASTGSVLGGVGSFDAGLAGGALGGIGGAGAATLPSFGTTGGAVPDASWGVNPRTDGAVATDTGGNNVDWLDELLNETGSNWDTGGLTAADQGAIDFGSSLNDVAGLPSGPSGLDVPGGVDAVNAGGPTGGMGGITMADLQKVPSSILKALGADTPAGMAKLLGNLGTGALSALSANKYADNMKELADRSWNAGSDYRNRLASTYTNPGAYLDSPEVKAITDRATNSLSRSLSARDGNPIGSGRALNEINDYAGQTMLGQLGNYRQQLANFGGQSQLSGNYSQLGSQSADAGSNIYNSLANTVSRVTQPQTDWASIMKQFGLTNSPV